MTKAYAAAGVDYTKIQPFKDAMVSCGKRTVKFPLKRGVHVPDGLVHTHGAVFQYIGENQPIWVNTIEGLGNKNWIAEWMYQFSGTGQTYYEGIGDDTMQMAVNDALAQGALPVVYLDEVAAGTSEWFEDAKRSEALAQGYLAACQRDGIALLAGESPALRYLVKATTPVTDAPVLSGTIVSLISPAERLITGEDLRPGLRIVGVTSSGVHANGISLVIKKALELPDSFLTELETGRTLGEEALIPTRSYVALIEALLDADVDISVLLPSTGDGVAKLAFDKRQLQYRVHSWLPEDKIPYLFRFLHQACGISLEDCLKTFNWGFGYYIFVPASQVNTTIDVGTRAGYELMEIGVVEDGPRQTIFEPERLTLPPPGE